MNSDQEWIAIKDDFADQEVVNLLVRKPTIMRGKWTRMPVGKKDHHKSLDGSYNGFSPVFIRTAAACICRHGDKYRQQPLAIFGRRMALKLTSEIIQGI